MPYDGAAEQSGATGRRDGGERAPLTERFPRLARLDELDDEARIAALQGALDALKGELDGRRA